MIVVGTFVFVFQDAVGFVDFFEFFFGRLITPGFVGVIFVGEFAVRGTHFVVRCAAWYA